MRDLTDFLIKQCFSSSLSFYFKIVGLLLFFAFPFSAQAQNDPLQAAKQLNQEFDNGQISQMYNDFGGQFLQNKVTQAAFVAQFTIIHDQLGGPATSRSTITAGTGQDPDTGDQTFSIEYKATYPASAVYEQLSLIDEGSAGWKFYGLYFYPIH